MLSAPSDETTNSMGLYLLSSFNLQNFVCSSGEKFSFREYRYFSCHSSRVLQFVSTRYCARVLLSRKFETRQQYVGVLYENSGAGIIALINKVTVGRVA